MILKTSLLNSLKTCSKVSFKGFAKNKITQISELAASSFGLKFCQDSFSLQLRLLIEQIKFIDAQVCDVEAEIKVILDKINSPIMTVPGVGNINAAVILGEIGDISRFSNASKLAAYAGIDASVSQSGEYQSTNNKMSKRGSPYLRKALFQAALIAAFHDPVFSAFYQKSDPRASIILLLLVLLPESFVTPFLLF